MQTAGNGDHRIDITNRRALTDIPIHAAVLPVRWIVIRHYGRLPVHHADATGGGVTNLDQHILGDLYAAAEQASRWPRLLDGLCRATGMRSAVAQILDVDPDQSRQRWCARDLMSQADAARHDRFINTPGNPRFDVGQLPVRFPLQRVGARRRGGELRLDVRRLTLDLGELLDLQADVLRRMRGRSAALLRRRRPAARRHQHARHRAVVRSMVAGALLIAGFFTFPLDRLMGHWLFGY